MNSIEQEFREIKLAESQLHSLQSQFSQQWSQFQLFQSQYTQNWTTLQSSLIKIQTSLKNRTQEVEERERSLELAQQSVDDRQKELDSKEKLLNSAERFVCDRCKTLGFKVSETGNVVVKIEPSSEFKDDCSVNDASVKLFVTMDGKTLQMFLNDSIGQHSFIGEEMKSGIKLSNDPAKLVLDAMEGFFPPNLEHKGYVVRSSCVLLLEQLMELKPKIKKAVREEARAVAMDWIKKVNADKGSYMVVLGFVLLVFVYKLWLAFDRDELRGFCDVVQKHRVSSMLRLKLGFIRMCESKTTGSQFQKEEPCTLRAKYVSTSPTPDSPIDLRNSCEDINASGLKPPAKYVSASATLGSPIDLRNSCEDVNDSGLKPPAKYLSASPTLDSPIDLRNSCDDINASGLKPPAKIPKYVSATPNSPIDLRNLCEDEVGSMKPQAKYVSASPTPGSPIDLTTLCEDKNAGGLKPLAKYVSASPTPDSPIDLATLCEDITASGLKSYLKENVKNLKLIEDKVLDCLRGSSDSAKVVLDVVRDFYLELDGYQGETSISCCNFLLDQLVKLSPLIKFALKEEAVNFATRWKARMESAKPILVFGFLKFLSAYRLSSSFQADEILSLFNRFYERDDIYEPKRNPSLCRALGLEAKIPDLIQSLIEENKQLAAVHYICAFNLTDKFPPGPLLKSYLKYTNASALKTWNNLNDSVEAQNKCADKQIRALQSAIRCIFDFELNLDSELSPIDLQQRIRQLEKEIEERNSSQLENEKTGTKKRSAAQTSPQSDPTGMKKPTLHHRSTLKSGYCNAADARASNMNMLNQPSSKFRQYGSHNSTGFGMTPNLYSTQVGASTMPYTNFSPTVNSIDPHPNLPHGVSHPPHFSAPSPGGYSSK